MATPIEFLPAALREKSISRREIVLPLAEALDAIDVLESNGFLILGYEGWVKTEDGRVGHGSAGRHCASYPANLSVEERAALCRRQLVEDSEAWQAQNSGTTDLLHFCIAIRLA